MSLSSRSVPETSEEDLSRLWREEGLRYVSAINAYVERGMKHGWNKAGNQPDDTRSSLAPAVMEVVRRANQEGKVESLRDRFPPAHEPLLEQIKEGEQSLPVVLLLDDGRIVLRIGAPYEAGRVVVIDGDQIREQPTDVVSVGRSPDGRLFAVARSSGVTVHEGWDGRGIAEHRVGQRVWKVCRMDSMSHPFAVLPLSPAWYRFVRDSESSL